MKNEFKYNFYIGRKCLRHGRKKVGELKKSSTKPVKPVVEISHSLKLRNRAKRVHSTLRLILSNIDPRPFWFVTIVFPPHRWATQLEKRTQEKVQGLLARLHRAFKHAYEKGYLVWSIEYSHRKGIHVHYACRTKTKISAEKLQNWFCKKWHGICEFDDDNAVDVRRYDRINGKAADGLHDNYLTKKSKLKHKMALIDTFNNKNTFGFVNRNNIPFFEDENFTLNEDELNRLRPLMIKDLKRQREEIMSSLEDDDSKAQKVALLKVQYLKIKSGFSRHYSDDDLRSLARKCLREMGKV